MEERLSQRTSVQMLNFIAEHMLCDGAVKETPIPTPVDKEWDAVIEEVQNNEEILQDLVKNVVETHTKKFEAVAAEKLVEIAKNHEDTPILHFQLTEETMKQQTILVEERKQNSKNTIKKRVFGLFRRSKKKT